VTTAKVKKEAITASKVKKGTLTGTQIKASTLGTVPKAQLAEFAEASRASRFAEIADKVAHVPPPEPWHEVGASGEPQFQNGWENLGTRGMKPPGSSKTPLGSCI
jgi:hypothetical protein